MQARPFYRSGPVNDKNAAFYPRAREASARKYPIAGPGAADPDADSPGGLGVDK
jgi:hypothetical protein